MPTYISELHLNNFRLFKEANIQLHPNLCVFLGDNGCGKTTIIDSIAILISGIYRAIGEDARFLHPISARFSERHKQAIKGLFSEYARSTTNSSLKGYLHISETIAELKHQFYHLERNGNMLQQIQDMSDHSGEQSLAKLMQSENAVAIPTFAKYGTDRNTFSTMTEAVSSIETPPFAGTPLMAHVDAMQSKLDFNSFLSWFNQEETVELRNQRYNKQYYSRELDAVRRAIERVFENSERKISSPRFEASPLRFVVTETTDEGNVDLDFSQLSDGYRSMVALVADFARRLSIANQNSDIDPLNGEGILMIDEIDAHLHPKWQYRVIEDLRRTFPNVQLIVTTHSPEIISTVDKDNVYILQTQNGELQTTHPRNQTRGCPTANIVTEVMGAQAAPINVPEFSTYLDCLVYIQQGDIESESFKHLYEQTLAHYGETHPLVTEMNARLAGEKHRKSIAAKYKRKIL